MKLHPLCPLVPVKGWAIVSTRNEPWGEPGYVRFGMGAYGAWEAFNECHGRYRGEMLHDQIAVWEEEGYRAVEVLVSPLTQHLTRD